MQTCPLISSQYKENKDIVHIFETGIMLTSKLDDSTKNLKMSLSRLNNTEINVSSFKLQLKVYMASHPKLQCITGIFVDVMKFKTSYCSKNIFI